MAGKQRGNNATELTCIAPLKPDGAHKLRVLFSEREEFERQGGKSPIEMMGTIHYARWVIIDGGKRLLFTSNFDGGLTDYLKDFAERDARVLDAIFQHCEGWPGAKPVQGFIQYVEGHQIPASYFYAAYPRHTVGEVKRALYWKKKTEDFLKEIGEPRANEKKEIRELREALAQPTPWPIPES